MRPRAFLPGVRSGRRWWVFGLLMVMALVFALIIGNYLARLHEPTEVGTSALGEWGDLGDQGLRLRLDEMVMAKSFPDAYGEQTSAPEGMEFLRVRMTIDPVATDLDGSCIFELHNGDGENLGLRELAVEGPPRLDCIDFSEDSDPPSGDPFETQTVFVVVPEPIESYSIQVHLITDENETYRTFTP